MRNEGLAVSADMGGAGTGWGCAGSRGPGPVGMGGDADRVRISLAYRADLAAISAAFAAGSGVRASQWRGSRCDWRFRKT